MWNDKYPTFEASQAAWYKQGEKRILTWLQNHASHGYWVRVTVMERSSSVLNYYGKNGVRRALTNLAKAGTIEVNLDARPMVVRLKLSNSE